MGRKKQYKSEEAKLKAKRARAKKFYNENKEDQDKKARERYYRKKDM